MANLEELIIRIKADTAQLQAEMNKAQSIVKGSSDSMKSSLGGIAAQAKALLPALSAVAFASFAKGAFQAADRLNDLAQRTGVAATTLSALNIPLLQGGSNVEEFAGSINKMNNIIGEAAKGGSQDLLDTFDKLGLSVTKLMQLSPEDQFYQIATALNNIKNQAEFTNTGMSIFGRSFSSLAPLIKSSNGNLAEFVKTMQKQGSSLTQEQLDRIDKFGDSWTSAWEHAKLGAVDFLTYLLKISDWVANQPSPSGALLLARTGIPPIPKGTTSAINPGTIVSFEKFGPPQQTEKQRNDDLRKIAAQKKAAEEATKAREDAIKSLADYNDQLTRQRNMAELTAKEQAGAEVYYKTVDLADKGRIKNAVELAEKNRILAESIYEIKEAQQEAARTAELMRNKLSDALTNAIIDFDSAGNAAKNFARAIASTIIQKSIADPLAMAIAGNGTAGSGIIGGFTKMLGFASGADNIPNDMVAQIHKGEMIIPRVQAEAIRSGNNGGGQSIVVQQYFQVSNDVPALIQAHIRNAAPTIASAAHNAVFASIQRGGSAAKIVGVR